MPYVVQLVTHHAFATVEEAMRRRNKWLSQGEKPGVQTAGFVKKDIIPMESPAIMEAGTDSEEIPDAAPGVIEARAASFAAAWHAWKIGEPRVHTSAFMDGLNRRDRALFLGIVHERQNESVVAEVNSLLAHPSSPGDDFMGREHRHRLRVEREIQAAIEHGLRIAAAECAKAEERERLMGRVCR